MPWDISSPGFFQTERKRRKAGAVTSHAKIAEKLLAARMRKDALERAQGSSYVWIYHLSYVLSVDVPLSSATKAKRKLMSTKSCI